MKGKRSKQYRKLMQQYQLGFAFREPYQVLLDADLIKDAARVKMQLGKMLQNTLHGDIKPMITQCCIRHLYHAAPEPDKDAWIAVAKAAERRRCGHHELDEPLSALACIESVVDPKAAGTNRHRYVVAAQDEAVRRRMRQVAGVPLVYIARSVMILEPMAGATHDVRERGEAAKLRAGLPRRQPAGAGEKRKRDGGDDDEEEAAGPAATPEQLRPRPKKRQAKGPKGPNPLSVKKPKKAGATDQPRRGGSPAAQNVDGAAEKKKRVRRRKPKETAADAHADPASGDED